MAPKSRATQPSREDRSALPAAVRSTHLRRVPAMAFLTPGRHRTVDPDQARDRVAAVASSHSCRDSPTATRSTSVADRATSPTPDLSG